MRAAIVFYCLVVSLWLFLVSHREEISHECMQADRHRARKTPPPESSMRGDQCPFRERQRRLTFLNSIVVLPQTTWLFWQLLISFNCQLSFCPCCSRIGLTSADKDLVISRAHDPVAGFGDHA